MKTSKWIREKIPQCGHNIAHKGGKSRIAAIIEHVNRCKGPTSPGHNRGINLSKETFIGLESQRPSTENTKEEAQSHDRG